MQMLLYAPLYAPLRYVFRAEMLLKWKIVTLGVRLETDACRVVLF